MHTIEVDPKQCGIGTARCCAYLMMGATYLCGRDAVGDIVRVRVAEGTINAKRLPVGPYPSCQSEDQEEVDK